MTFGLTKGPAPAGQDHESAMLVKRVDRDSGWIWWTVYRWDPESPGGARWRAGAGDYAYKGSPCEYAVLQ
jgi:hypothetical protein